MNTTTQPGPLEVRLSDLLGLVEKLRSPWHHGDCKLAADAIERMSAELAEWRKLRDPANLHVNLLRGLPAQLTREQAMHLCADDLQRVAELEAVAKHEADCAEAFKAEADDLRQQLDDEKRQHDITRGDLERTRLVRDELLAADDGRNVVIGGRPPPVAICTRMDLTDAQREQLRTTMVVTKA